MKHKLHSWLDAFRWRKLLLIWAVFLAMAAILFAERSGIRYASTQFKIDYLPRTEVKPASIAMFGQPVTCLLLYDSGQEGTDQVKKQFDQILLDMIDDMAKRYPGVETDKFFLFGHSGGGQFVNRFLFAHPEKLRACAIGAPGRPTFLNPDEDYFWGTRDFKNYFGHDVDLAAVQKVPVLVIVGENDTKFIGDSPYGDNRVARMNSLQKNLQDHGVHTELTILPGFAHEGGEKERVQAAQHFFEAYL